MEAARFAETSVLSYQSRCHTEQVGLQVTPKIWVVLLRQIST
jgi:hypothetical protein